MNKRTLLALLLVATSSSAQVLWNDPNAPRPCRGSAIIDADSPGRLDSLVRAASLIIVGRGVRVLPAVMPDPDHRSDIQTPSLISVDRVLHGAVPNHANTIAITQMGGEVPPCKLLVQDDPLVQVQERYVLFLRPDNRTVPPNTTGAPRFEVVGVWTGKVKIIDGRIQFALRAGKQLHQYDGTNLSAFITILDNLTHPPPPPPFQQPKH